MALTGPWDHEAISARGRVAVVESGRRRGARGDAGGHGGASRPQVETAGRALRSRLLRMGWS